jgi:hypothetical protein
MLSTGDKLEILDLYSRYIHTLNKGDGDGFAACFTADGIFNRPNGSKRANIPATRTVGTDAIAQLIRKAYQDGSGLRRRSHANILITEGEAEGEARGEASFLLIIASGAGPASIALTGIARDRFRRTSAGWRFAERDLILDVE